MPNWSPRCRSSRAACFSVMRWALPLLMMFALPVWADDGVPSSGRLSDADFYRAATCGAEVGGACRKDPIFWTRKTLTVRLLRPQAGFPRSLVPRLDRALDQAIASINAAGAGITLVRDDRRPGADIIVTPSALFEGEETRGIARMADGQVIGVGLMQLWWNARNRATQASILIAADISPRDLPSVMLEELFQSLGFLYDLDNPYYNGRSILAQDSNATLTIAGQDQIALLRHYPPDRGVP